MVEKPLRPSEVLAMIAGLVGLFSLFSFLVYVSGYRGGLDGSTLDPAGTIAWIVAGLVGALLCVSLGLRLGGH